MTQFISRAYNRFTLDEARGLIIKKSETDRLNDEINYYKALPLELSIFFPRLYASYTKNGIHTMELEYYAYKDLGKLMVEGRFASNKDLWRKIFERIKDILDAFKKYTAPGNQEDFESMYIKKTLTEYENLKQKFPAFKKICSEKELVINGMQYKNFEQIWLRIEPKIRALFGQSFTAFHGDLCFSNILYGQSEDGHVVLKLIDPRGRFGKVGYFGDYRYDFAKLMHSFDGGYEYIIRDAFLLKHRGNVIDFTFKNDHRAEIEKVFYKIFKYSKEYKMLQGLIFIGMCARHYDSMERQKIMYATGVRILNESLL